MAVRSDELIYSRWNATDIRGRAGPAIMWLGN